MISTMIAEEPYVLTKVNFPRGENRDKIRAGYSPAGETEAERQHESSHSIVGERGNEGG